MYLPGLTYHIVQRGNNREACFFELENYQFYLELWKKISKRYGVAVHAYCLMSNHIHFLLTPETGASISNTMRVVGSSYAQYINRHFKRTGTLWEGRHRSSLVQSDKYLLTCYRYIELNPVRAGVVKRPEDYCWSSYRVNAWGNKSWLVPHVEYARLGVSLEERYYAYRELFRFQLRDVDLHHIRKAAHYCQPVSDEQFRHQVAGKYDMKLGQMKRGRPRKNNRMLTKK